MTRKIWLFRCFAIGVSVLILVFLEIALRFFSPQLDTSMERFRLITEKTEARRFSAIKEPDPDLLWRLKPGSQLSDDEFLNDRGFRCNNFSIPKPESTKRIVILGDSRSFGFGVINRHDIYTGQLQRFFDSLSLEKRIEVLNLSVIGYSSYQGRILSDILGQRLEPDVVLIWFGFNDLLYYHITDESAARSYRYLSIAGRMINKLFLYHWLECAWHRLTHRASEHVVLQQPITERVPPEQYEKNLRSLIRGVRKIGARPILLTSPVRPEIPIVLNSRVRNVRDRSGNTEVVLVTQYEINGYWLMDQTDFPGSEAELDRLIAENSDIAILRYFKGVRLRRRGDDDQAAFEFDEAKTLDETRRAVTIYNEITRRVSADTKTDCIDLVHLFDNYRNNLLFVDDCHPNVNGHGLIAAAIMELLTGATSRIVETESGQADNHLESRVFQK
ncbi:SGNH/GDSL hydrolase family protein [bacterium]|nr:SGNH/GDSL hydrolase family protein [candidate division CSSED10-310 bacterium]